MLFLQDASKRQILNYTIIIMLISNTKLQQIIENNNNNNNKSPFNNYRLTSNISIFLTVPNVLHSSFKSLLISVMRVGSSWEREREMMMMMMMMMMQDYLVLDHCKLTSNSLGSNTFLNTMMRSFFFLEGPSVLLSLQSRSLQFRNKTLILIMKGVKQYPLLLLVHFLFLLVLFPLL